MTTITGGHDGQILTIIFQDSNIVIANEDAHTANTIDLVAAANFSASVDEVLMLIFDGTSWYEIARSVN